MSRITRKRCVSSFINIAHCWGRPTDKSFRPPAARLRFLCSSTCEFNTSYLILPYQPLKLSIKTPWKSPEFHPSRPCRQVTTSTLLLCYKIRSKCAISLTGNERRTMSCSDTTEGWARWDAEAASEYGLSFNTTSLTQTRDSCFMHSRLYDHATKIFERPLPINMSSQENGYHTAMSQTTPYLAGPQRQFLVKS
ncbi:hypothetical protein EDD22DRAFT_184022 [Suillus occidentalis]|nr:hypothetical protein EDD22DRAFT_184022 [Suillus occidentalis]